MSIKQYTSGDDKLQARGEDKGGVTVCYFKPRFQGKMDTNLIYPSNGIRRITFDSTEHLTTIIFI
jgi:hypothetical protein